MNLYKLGVLLVMIGFSLFAVSLVTLIVANVTETISPTVGGCIILFFIPICFGIGTTPEVLAVLIVVSIMMALIALIMYKISRKLVRETISLT